MNRLIHPETENYKFWKPEEIEKLREFTGKYSFEEMTKIYFTNRTPLSLQRKSTKLGLISGYKHKKYSHNENYFNIFNPINCYWAGFFAADGSIRSKNSIAISLNGRDLLHLEKFKLEMEFTGNIKTYQRENYKKKTLKTVSTLNICGAENIVNNLSKNFNITNRKLYYGSPININNDYFKLCFILGYIDGDGWLTKTVNRDELKIGIVSCNFEILNWIREQFVKLTGKYNKIHKKNGKNCYTYLITGYNALSIYDYLRNFKLPLLERKWCQPHILTLLEEKRQKYPEKFSQINIPSVKCLETETV